MAPGELLSVPDAARLLRVDPSRVRALLSAGQLAGDKIGGRWLVSDASIRARQEKAPGRGRRLKPANAWAVLALASGAEAPWVSAGDRSRLAALLRQRGFQNLVGRLDERAIAEPYYAHPGVLSALRQDGVLVPAGVHAERDRGPRLLAGDEVDAYVAPSDRARLVGEFALQPSDEANVVLRVLPEGLWPFENRRMPLAAAAVDLAEMPDARARRIGKGLIAELQAGSA